jgi:hypothetical protein
MKIKEALCAVNSHKSGRDLIVPLPPMAENDYFPSSSGTSNAKSML